MRIFGKNKNRRSVGGFAPEPPLASGDWGSALLQKMLCFCFFRNFCIYFSLQTL